MARVSLTGCCGGWQWQNRACLYLTPPRLDFAFPQFSIRTTKDIILVGIIAALSFFHSLTQTNTCGRYRDIILYTDNTITFNKHYHCLNELFWEKIEKFPNNSIFNPLTMSQHTLPQTTHQEWWVLFLHKIPNWNEWKPLVSNGWFVPWLVSYFFPAISPLITIHNSLCGDKLMCFFGLFFLSSAGYYGEGGGGGGWCLDESTE